MKYPLPECIRAQCTQARYSKWLHRKAMAHVRRDRKREKDCTVARYEAEIHAAVCESGNRDFYTGERLDWSLISTWDNESAKRGRAKYKRTLALLPTVDHTADDHGRQKFVTCSWSVNDAKSDLTLEQFYQLCERVLKYRDQNNSG
jgi:hypothetical protein